MTKFLAGMVIALPSGLLRMLGLAGRAKIIQRIARPHTALPGRWRNTLIVSKEVVHLLT